MFCKVEDVITFTGLKPKHLALPPETDADEFEGIIVDWILQAEDMITSYTHNKFESDVPLTVTNVCIRLTSNIVALAQARRDTPIVKHDDWNKDNIVSSNVFTSDLKADLQPFVKDFSNSSDPIDIFTITGD